MGQDESFAPGPFARDLDRPGSARRNSKAALLQAAVEEFTELGYESATVAGIADRAGVTTGALYAHFSGKLELLLMSLGLNPSEDVIRLMVEMASHPRREQLHLLSGGLSNPPPPRSLLLLDVVVAARRDPHIAATLRQGMRQYLDATTRATESAVATGLVKPVVQPADWARLVMQLTLGLIVLTALDEPPAAVGAYEQLIELLLYSGGVDPKTPEPPALSKVAASADAVERSRRALHRSIVDAVADGHSLRQVGAAAGLSHERVRQVLHEAAPGRT